MISTQYTTIMYILFVPKTFNIKVLCSSSKSKIPWIKIVRISQIRVHQIRLADDVIRRKLM